MVDLPCGGKFDKRGHGRLGVYVVVELIERGCKGRRVTTSAVIVAATGMDCCKLKREAGYVSCRS
jgi:hypothetical protein